MKKGAGWGALVWRIFGDYAFSNFFDLNGTIFWFFISNDQWIVRIFCFKQLYFYIFSNLFCGDVI